MIRKKSLIPLIPLKDTNQARIDAPNTNDANDMPIDTNNISLMEINENHAQNRISNDINDTNDTLHNFKETLE